MARFVDAPADIIVLEGWMLGFKADFVSDEGAFPGELEVCVRI